MSAFADFELVKSSDEESEINDRGFQETVDRDRLIYEGWICGAPGCEKGSFYNYRGYKAGWCSTHMDKDEMIDVVNKRCNYQGCMKHPSYGEKDSTVALFCASHKAIHHVNLKSKRCNYPGCTTIPIYGEKESSFALFCKTHKQAYHVDVKHPKCNHLGCKTRPHYGEESQMIALYCKIHKEEHHVNVKSKRCNYEGCVKQPFYGEEGSKFALFCASHKEAHHVNVKSKRCNYPGCTIMPTYGEEGSKYALFCASHKEANHVNVKSERCNYPGCTTIPTYGRIREKKSICCVQHKSDDMIRIKGGNCIYIDASGPCNIRASYCKEGDKIASFCKNHSTPDMIYLSGKKCVICHKTYAVFGKSGEKNTHCKKCAETGMVDVRNVKCNYISASGESCGKSACYNLPGHPPVRCNAHRLSGFVSSPRARCKFKGCSNTAVFSHSTKPTHCSLHQEPPQTNITERKCISCGLLFLLDLAGLCEYCNHGNPFPILPNTVDLDIPPTSPFYPSHSQAASSVPIDTSTSPSSPTISSTDPPSTHRNPKLAKQNLIQDLLHHHQLMPDSIDLPLDKGECALYRPDFVFYGQPNPYHLVILEVDEDQHSSYACDCEQQRMVNLFHAQGGMPIHFIRYNPDAYKRPGQTRRQINETPAKRHRVLLAYLRQALQTNPLSQGALVQVTYLFYDGYQPGEATRTLLSPEPGYCALADFVIEED